MFICNYLCFPIENNLDRNMLVIKMSLMWLFMKFLLEKKCGQYIFFFLLPLPWNLFLFSPSSISSPLKFVVRYVEGQWSQNPSLVTLGPSCCEVFISDQKDEKQTARFGQGHKSLVMEQKPPDKYFCVHNFISWPLACHQFCIPHHSNPQNWGRSDVSYAKFVKLYFKKHHQSRCIFG